MRWHLPVRHYTAGVAKNWRPATMLLKHSRHPYPQAETEPAAGAVVGFTIYRATTKLGTEKTISPKDENVQAARGT